jgi:hypothetical protein
MGAIAIILLAYLVGIVPAFIIAVALDCRYSEKCFPALDFLVATLWPLILFIHIFRAFTDR